MEEVSIVWEYDSLNQPYKGWAERIIREHLHPYVFPVPKSYTELKHLIFNAKLGEIPTDFEEKFKIYVSDINKWLDEDSIRTTDSSPQQFTDFNELLPQFTEYFIRDLAKGEGDSLIFLDVLGRHRYKDYALGRLVFIQKEGLKLLDFYADFQHSWKVHSLIYENDFKISLSPQSGTDEPLIYNPQIGEIMI